VGRPCERGEGGRVEVDGQRYVVAFCDCTRGADGSVSEAEFGDVLCPLDNCADIGFDHFVPCVCGAGERVDCGHCVYGKRLSSVVGAMSDDV
jgi:hypothetical protein